MNSNSFKLNAADKKREQRIQPSTKSSNNVLETAKFVQQPTWAKTDQSNNTFVSIGSNSK